jgi:hypothetical protein
LENGILDMEDLSEIKDNPKDKEEKKKLYLLGPYSYKGSNDLTMVYKYGETMKYRGRIYQTPES